MLLVLGAAGGVGIAAVQIGKVCGATVIAVARYDLHSIMNFYSLSDTKISSHELDIS